MGDIEENNRMIAEYMDGIYSKLPWLELKRYHSDWNALMPVVLKIMREGEGVISIAQTRQNDISVSLSLINIIQPIYTGNPDPILAIWECVVQYIKSK